MNIYLWKEDIEDGESVMTAEYRPVEYGKDYDVVNNWIIRGEIHHLSGVWKSMFRFLGNHDSGKNGITFFLNPYNDVMHF